MTPNLQNTVNPVYFDPKIRRIFEEFAEWLRVPFNCLAISPKSLFAHYEVKQFSFQEVKVSTNLFRVILNNR